MTTLTEQEFRVRSDEALDQARRALLPLADQAGFEVELQNGVLNLVFEEPSEMKFVISPNAPVRQIWVSRWQEAISSRGRPNWARSRWTARRCRSCSNVSRDNSSTKRPDRRHTLEIGRLHETYCACPRHRLRGDHGSLRTDV